MNNFLKINKKILILFLIFVSAIFCISVFLNKIKITNFEKNNQIKIVDNQFDIINPSFTINNDKEKISVKAKKGNFIDNNIISLEKNVSFISERFEIFSDQVLFNRKEQTAISKSSSKFFSKGTEINSEGFSIIDKGNIILFNGKTSLILNQ